MSRRFDFYRIKHRENLGDPATWDRRFEDLDVRIAAREDDATKLDAAIDGMIAIGLDRLNETFTPLFLQQEDRLRNSGVSFVAFSSSEVEIGLGTKEFVLPTLIRDSFVQTDYVTARPQADLSRGMTCLVISLDRSTGVLTLDPQLVMGSGTYDAWEIRTSAPPDLAHATRTDNPHATTAAQVGAYTREQVDWFMEALVITPETIAGLAPKASPELTGKPLAPNPIKSTNDQTIATCQFVHTVVADAIAGLFYGGLGGRPLGAGILGGEPPSE